MMNLQISAERISIMSKRLGFLFIISLVLLIYLGALHFKVRLRVDDDIMKHNIVNINSASEDLICSDGNTSYFLVHQEFVDDLLNGYYIYELARQYEEKVGNINLLNTVSLCMVLERSD